MCILVCVQKLILKKQDVNVNFVELTYDRASDGLMFLQISVMMVVHSAEDVTCLLCHCSCAKQHHSVTGAVVIWFKCYLQVLWCIFSVQMWLLKIGGVIHKWEE